MKIALYLYYKTNYSFTTTVSMALALTVIMEYLY